MKTLTVFLTATLGLAVTPFAAHASSLGQIEKVRLTLDSKKFDTSIPAAKRFEKLERVAERTCDTSSRSLYARKVEKACAAEVKRSVLSQVGDDALKAEAKRRGIL
jgi:UrcA family protein